MNRFEYCNVSRKFCTCIDRCEHEHAPQVSGTARPGGETSTPPAHPAARHELLGMWWHPAPWRGSPAQKRSDAALATVIVGESLPVATEPDPMLRMQNPSCAHDRTAYDQMHCVECKAWTAAHWADRIDVGRFGR